ncbi:MAG: ferrous iron transport protein B [Candidatus Odinarchaeota archaeon]|nr:ferrous iron transport protein B [Candidatus Odinarchaeota archaeon]
MRIKVALVGHPNVGKSVIFNDLTGLNAIVSNYPGTTVEVYRGSIKWKGFTIEIVDTPGTYSMTPSTQAEEVTRRVILEEMPDVIVHVIDAVSIKRHLYLTLELLEIGIPLILVVNQIDRAEALKINVSKEELESLLGIPVIMCVAVKRVGIEALLDSIIESHKCKPPAHPRYSKTLEKYLKLVEEALREKLPHKLKRFSRFIATQVILGDEEFKDLLSLIPEHLRAEIPNYGRQFILERVKKADDVYEKSVNTENAECIRLSRIDYISVKSVFGIIVMAALTLAVTWATLGLIHMVGHRIPSMFYENFYDPFIRNLIEELVPEGPVRYILIGEKPGTYSSLGLLTTGVFFVFFMILPALIVLFFVLGVLEDAGILPRLSVSFHKPLYRIGLSGDAVMPLVTGTGCSIVGVLSTRTLRNDKNRIIASFLQVLGIPCMAQQVMIWRVLGDYGLIYILVLYLLLLSIILITGLILNMIVPGEDTILLLEIPPWRKPQLRNLLRKTYTRILSFLRNGVPLVFLGVLLANLIYYTGIVTMIAELLSPVMSGLFKLPSETCVALIISVLRKDVAVGILGGYSLSPLQMLTAVTVVSLTFPCIGSFAILLSEFGIKRTLKMMFLMFIISLVVGSLLGILSSIVNI